MFGLFQRLDTNTEDGGRERRETLSGGIRSVLREANRSRRSSAAAGVGHPGATSHLRLWLCADQLQLEFSGESSF